MLSPNDEFADFGTWDKGNLNLSEIKKDEMLVHEYARSGLQLGMQLEDKLGTNPFKFGMIGSTDSHTGLTTADDDNFFGKHAGSEPSAERYEHPFAKFGDLEISQLGDSRFRDMPRCGRRRTHERPSSTPWNAGRPTPLPGRV